MTVAILGTGHMGGAVVRACSAKGISLVVWNRTLSRAMSLQADRVQVVSRAAEAIVGADLVVSNLLSGDALVRALREEDARRALAGKTLIAMTTTSASEAKRVATLTLDMGAKAFVDVATISWPNEIAAGRGKILTGGSLDDFTVCENFLGALGTVECVGEVGSA